MPTPVEASFIANVLDFKDYLSTLGTSSALCLDLEGVNLSRHGNISIITILALPSNRVQLIDIATLGTFAFETTEENGRNLKSIFEDPSICQYIWDVRNDADALWSHYRVSLHGIIDTQLLENASRFDDKTYIRGLKKCVQYDLKLSFAEMNRWLRTKKETQRLMHTNIFTTRPVDSKAIEYCLNDVVHLPALRQKYLARVKPDWYNKAVEESSRRVNEAQTPMYNPQAEKKKLGPWGSGGQPHSVMTKSMYEIEMDDYYDNDYDDDLFYNEPPDCEDWGALDSS